MTIAGILRMSVAPVAARLVSRQRIHHISAAFSLVRRHGSFSLQRTDTPRCAALGTELRSHRRHYAANSDKKQAVVIDSEIECAVESNADEAVEVPEGFPFTIQDTPFKNKITLEREYDGENIVVEVHMPNHLMSGEDGEYPPKGEADSNVPLTIQVSKGNGAVLEFSCTAFPDKITIDAISMKNPEVSEENIAYEGPDFADMGENLQKAFHKYLEIRGIKPSITNFLHEYMVNKNDKEYRKWFNDVKEFVAA